MARGRTVGSDPARPAAARLPRCGLQPLQQGTLSGLCGLYAAINAVRLLCARPHGLTRLQAKRLYAAGIGFLDRQHLLAEAVMNGLDCGQWHQLLRAVIQEASAVTGVTITLAQPLHHLRRPTRTQTLVAIEEAIIRGHPVLVELAGVHRHFTAIAGYSAHRLTLFDSDALCWLTRESCGVGKHRPQRHRLQPKSLVTLALCASRPGSGNP